MDHKAYKSLVVTLVSELIKDVSCRVPPIQRADAEGLQVLDVRLAMAGS